VEKIIKKYENYSCGKGYSFKIGVDDYNTLIAEINCLREEIAKYEETTSTLNGTIKQLSKANKCNCMEIKGLLQEKNLI
jgi:hypothetical protein